MDAGLIGIAVVRPVAGAGPLVEPAPAPDLVTEETAESERPWVTIVWNDPVNLMSYVTLVFMRDLGHPRPVAEKLMMAVHTEGKASVSTGTREEMEATVARLQVAGLWATLQQD